MENIALNQFIAKAKKKVDGKIMNFKHDVERYGKLNFKRPESKYLIKYLNGLSNSMQIEDGVVIHSNYGELLKASSELVYVSCSFLQEKELREEFKDFDPLDLASELFGNSQTISLASDLNEAFQGEKEVKATKEAVKN